MCKPQIVSMTGVIGVGVCRTKSVNDHSQGLLAYKKKRLAFFEELDNTKHLNQGFCKDITGSEGIQTGRGMWQVSTEQWDWITKVVLAFNEGCMPRYADVTKHQLQCPMTHETLLSPTPAGGMLMTRR